MSLIALANQAISSETGEGPLGYLLRRMATEVGALTASDSGSHPSVRSVQVVDIPAYTRTGRVITGAAVNTALTSAMFDGIAPVVGQRVAITRGLATAGGMTDVGIYVITAVGSVSTVFVLTMADDWNTGLAKNGDTFQVQGGGTVYGNSTWKVFNSLDGVTVTDPLVVGTSNVALFPKTYKQSVVLGAVAGGNVASSYTIGLTGDAKPLFMMAGAAVDLTRTTAGGTATTVEYASTVKTPGQGAVTLAPYTGATLTVIGAVAAGTASATPDTSTLDVMVTNW